MCGDVYNNILYYSIVIVYIHTYVHDRLISGTVKGTATVPCSS